MFHRAEILAILAVQPGCRLSLSTAGTGTVICVPTYNEVGTLRELVRRVRQALPEAVLMIVDDASPDGTGDLARELAAADGNVRLLSRAGREGLGRAYVDAFQAVVAEDWTTVVQMDADLSHRPEDLPALLRPLQEGADLVVGSRYVPGGGATGWPIRRRIVSRAGGLWARSLLGLEVRDPTSGFRAWRVSALLRLNLRSVGSRGYAFQIEMAWQASAAGMRIEEVPITFVERRVGRSKMSMGIVVEAVRLVWQLRARRSSG